MAKILTKEDAVKLTGEHIVIPKEYTEIEMHAFANHEMQSLEIPGNFKVIGWGAFTNCSNLENLTIHDGVEKIGSNAFGGCIKLESVAIPASVKVIDDSAFIFCENLKSVSLSSGLVSIGGNAFCRTAIRNITIPDTVKYMYPIEGNELRSIESEYAVICDENFAGCYELTDINVDPKNEKFTSVDGVLFTKDKTILLDYPAGKPQKTYIIPDGVKIINHASFGGCRNLEKIIIPDSVTEIDDTAFIFCEKLESITIPKSVTRIEPSAFSNCENLTDIFADEDNAFFASIDGVLVSKDKTVLIRYPEGRSQRLIARSKDAETTEVDIHPGDVYLIPESITSIGYYAFSYGAGEKDDMVYFKVAVHDNVKNIDKWAFYNKEHFIIRCSENSYAHKHAQQEDIAYELIEE